MSQRRQSLTLFIVGPVLAFLLSVLIWGIHRESPRTLISFHGFLHAGITTRFLDPAGMRFPPENPFYAGEPLCYYWFHHFTAALLVRLFDWNVFYSLEALSFAAIAILVFSGLVIGRSLFRSTVAGILITLLVLAGTNPLGALYAVSRIARYGTRLLADDPNYLWGVVGPMYGLIRYEDVGGLYGPFWNFFLNITSRPLALALLVALGYFLERAMRKPTLGSRVGLAAAGAAVGAFNPAMGVAVTCALVLSLGAMWFWEARRGSASAGLRERRASYAWASLALVIGLLAASPTYYHLIFGPSDRTLQLWLFAPAFFKHLATIFLSIAPLATLALFGSLRLPRERRPFLYVLLLASAVLLMASLLLALPSSNESNFFHAAGVFLAIPAAGSVLRRDETDGERPVARWRVAAIAILFLPTPMLLSESYLGRPPVPVDFRGVLPARLPAGSDLARLYDWVMKGTPGDALFVLDPRAPRITAGGNMSEFPAMTGRVILMENPNHYLVRPYPDSGSRSDLAVRLLSGEPVREADRAYLRRLRRPVYVVVWGEGGASRSRLGIHYGAPVFQVGGIVVFRLPV